MARKKEDVSNNGLLVGVIVLLVIVVLGFILVLNAIQDIGPEAPSPGGTVSLIVEEPPPAPDFDGGVVSLVIEEENSS